MVGEVGRCRRQRRLVRRRRSATAGCALGYGVGRRRALVTGGASGIGREGVIHIKPLAEVAEADWDQTPAVNLKGAFLSAQAAAPALTASGRGRIVAIASDAGKRAAPLLHAYSASKFGLVGLIQSLAGELAPHVTVNAVCPVSTPDTGMGRLVTGWKAAKPIGL